MPPMRKHYDAGLDYRGRTRGRATLCGNGDLRTYISKEVTCRNCKRILARMRRKFP